MGTMPKMKKEKKNKKKHEDDNQTINLDNEIVIGLRIKEDLPVEKPKNTKKATKKKAKKKKYNQNITPRKYKEQQQQAKQKRMKKFKVVKYILLVLLFIGGCIYIALSPIFNIKAITVVGNEKISTEQIISLSKIEKQTNLFQYKKSDIKQNVKQNAYIDTVSISRRYPDTIQITVTERKPAYILEFANTYVYMSSQGYLLEFVNEPTDFLIVTGFSTNTANIQVGNRLEAQDLQKLETIYRIVEAIHISELGQVVTKIDMTDVKNYKLILEGEQKTVYIGDGKDLSTRMLYIKTILEKEQGKAGEIFVDMDINSGEPPMFREKV